jgi:hypothetical protein
VLTAKKCPCGHVTCGVVYEVRKKSKMECRGLIDVGLDLKHIFGSEKLKRQSENRRKEKGERKKPEA